MIESSEKIQVETEYNPQNRTLSFTLKGIIDENAKFKPFETFFDTNNIDILVLNTQGIQLINSCGLRNWIQWFSQVPQNLKIIHKNCSKTIVDQMNILDGFLPPNSEIQSLAVPYYCDSCEHEEVFIAQKDKEFVPGPNGFLNLPEKKTCPQCKEEMHLDVVPQKYFHCLKLCPYKRKTAPNS